MCNVHTYELSIVLLYVEFDVIVKIGEKEVNQNNHKMNNYKSKNILSQSKGTPETLGKRNIHNTEKVHEFSFVINCTICTKNKLSFAEEIVSINSIYF